MDSFKIQLAKGIQWPLLVILTSCSRAILSIFLVDSVFFHLADRYKRFLVLFCDFSRCVRLIFLAILSER